MTHTLRVSAVLVVSILAAAVSVQAQTLIEATLSNAGSGAVFDQQLAEHAINAGDTSESWGSGNADDGYVYDPNDPTANPPEQSNSFRRESLFGATNNDAENYWFADIDLTNELRFLDVWGRDDYGGTEQARHQDLIITLYDGTGATGTALFTSSPWNGVSTKDVSPASYGRFDFVAAGATVVALTTAQSIRIDHSSGSNQYLLLAEVRAAQVPEPSSFALLAGLFGLSWIMVRRRS